MILTNPYLDLIFRYPTPPPMFTAAFLEAHKDADDAYNYNMINHELTDMDKAYMVINYPRTTPHADAPEWTFTHALTVAGVDKKTQQTLIKQLNQGRIDDMRNVFNKWNAIKQTIRPTNSLPGMNQLKSILDSYSKIVNNIEASSTSS
jgi:hypothetical protein